MNVNGEFSLRRSTVLFCALLVLSLPAFETSSVPPPDVNDCLSAPCVNGGICADGMYVYTCMCVPGYTGTNCEYAPTTTVSTIAGSTTETTTIPTTTMPTTASPNLEVTFNGTLELPPADDGTNSSRSDLTLTCVNSYVGDFRKGFIDVIGRVNTNIKLGIICTTTPLLRFYAGDIIMLGTGSCVGNQIVIQFSLRLTTNLLYSMELMQQCAVFGGQYMQGFVNWRQPIIGGIFNCPGIVFRPPLFGSGGVKYVCSELED